MVSITLHSLFFALGAFCGVIVLWGRLRSHAISFQRLTEEGLFIFASGLGGARLAFFVAYPEYWTNFSDAFQLWQEGLVSFGGIVAGAVAALVIARRYPIEKRGEWLQAVMLATLIGWAIGRLGNAAVGESTGLLTAAMWAINGRIPVALFESIGCALIVVWGWRREGSVSEAWRLLLAYFVLRFLVDFGRIEPQVILGLSLGQLVALCGAVIAYVMMQREKA